MDLPKKARTADWQDGFLILDGEKKIKVPELSIELMERLVGFSLVGFHVKNYPFNDDLLKPFFGHRSMVNFGVENGNLTDACFRKCAKFCVCQVLEGGGRNLSPLFYDVG